MASGYKLWFNGTSPMREAKSMREALRIARRTLGVSWLYRGARYVTDEPAGDGERRPVEALDLWRTRGEAERVTGSPADCVVMWG